MNIIQPEYFIPSLSLLMALITFIPSFSTSNETNENKINQFIDSTFVQHSSLGVACCCIPLIIQDLFYRPVRDFIPSQVPQRLLIFSLLLPALLIYITTLFNNLTPSIFFMSLN